MADLLLELFSEEIPARMQEDAALHLLQGLKTGLEKAGLAHKDSAHFSTPRRLAVRVEGLPQAQPDVDTELKGPKIDAPEAALQGFLKKTGLAARQLEKRDGVYFANIHQKGRPTADVLKELIEKILAEFPWPKSMRWGNGDTTWVRPLHSILCIFHDKVVPVEFAGIKAGNTTHGHRFLSPKAITVKHASEYESLLEKAHVIADREQRARDINEQAKAWATDEGLHLKADPHLLGEVTGLVEWPVVLMGTIDEQFMDLPKEVLVSEMRAHQKYFALETRDGALADRFLITANMETRDKGKAVIAGNERVLRARLSDGRFFWDQDRRRRLDEWGQALKNVTFHARLGTVADKVERIRALAAGFAPIVKADLKLADRAASLCKADLVTGMVGEFPELQGVMGRYYALHQGENPEVADAIRDHYRPQGPADAVPKAPVSVCIALADKLDTIFRMFAIGEKPTGSKDPFALRRAALGIIRLILENNLRLNLKQIFAGLPVGDIALHKAHDALVQKTEAVLHAPLDQAHKVGRYLTINESATQDIAGAVIPGLVQVLFDFFIDRLKVQLKDSGIRHDVIDAVMADGDDDLVRIVARARALQDFLASDDGANLLTAYKRAANILAIEEKKDKAVYAAGELDEAALKEKEEKDLAALLARQSAHIENLRAKEQFVEAMRTLASLRSAGDLFFDKIMVNCDDKGLRAHRLRLLAHIRDSMDGIANFAKIEG